MGIISTISKAPYIALGNGTRSIRVFRQSELGLKPRVCFVVHKIELNTIPTGYAVAHAASAFSLSISLRGKQK